MQNFSRNSSRLFLVPITGVLLSFSLMSSSFAASELGTSQIQQVKGNFFSRIGFSVTGASGIFDVNQIGMAQVEFVDALDHHLLFSAVKKVRSSKISLFDPRGKLVAQLDERSNSRTGESHLSYRDENDQELYQGKIKKLTGRSIYRFFKPSAPSEIVLRVTEGNDRFKHNYEFNTLQPHSMNEKLVVARMAFNAIGSYRKQTILATAAGTALAGLAIQQKVFGKKQPVYTTPVIQASTNLSLVTQPQSHENPTVLARVNTPPVVPVLARPNSPSKVQTLLKTGPTVLAQVNPHPVVQTPTRPDTTSGVQTSSKIIATVQAPMKASIIVQKPFQKIPVLSTPNEAHLVVQGEDSSTPVSLPVKIDQSEIAITPSPTKILTLPFRPKHSINPGKPSLALSTPLPPSPTNSPEMKSPLSSSSSDTSPLSTNLDEREVEEFKEEEEEKEVEEKFEDEKSTVIQTSLLPSRPEDVIYFDHFNTPILSRMSSFDVDKNEASISIESDGRSEKRRVKFEEVLTETNVDELNLTHLVAFGDKKYGEIIRAFGDQVIEVKEAETGSSVLLKIEDVVQEANDQDVPHLVEVNIIGSDGRLQSAQVVAPFKNGSVVAKTPDGIRHLLTKEEIEKEIPIEELKLTQKVLYRDNNGRLVVGVVQSAELNGLVKVRVNGADVEAVYVHLLNQIKWNGSLDTPTDSIQNKVMFVRSEDGARIIASVQAAFKKDELTSYLQVVAKKDDQMEDVLANDTEEYIISSDLVSKADPNYPIPRESVLDRDSDEPSEWEVQIAFENGALWAKSPNGERIKWFDNKDEFLEPSPSNTDEMSGSDSEKGTKHCLTRTMDKVRKIKNWLSSLSR